MLRVAGGVKKKEAKRLHSNATGIEFYKSKGQHILRNPNVVKAIVEKSGVKNTDVVLEIGPGTGNLTNLLLQHAKKVIAIEVDPRMVLELTRRFQGSPLAERLQVVHADFLKTELPYFDLCVANIPYNISSPLTFKLLAHRPLFRAAVIMYQTEFAMRMVAHPGSSLYGRLSINCQLLARVSHVLKVGRGNFRPPPKVDSSVVRIEPRRPPPPLNFLEWDGLIRLCFSRKNKTLAATFKQAGNLILLHRNFETFQALNAAAASAVAPAGVQERAAPLPSALMADDDDVAMSDVDCESDSGAGDAHGVAAKKQARPARRGGGKVPPEFRSKVLQVLSDAGFAEARAAKMSKEDFLALLASFNAVGIHFA